MADVLGGIAGSQQEHPLGHPEHLSNRDAELVSQALGHSGRQGLAADEELLDAAQVGLSATGLLQHADGQCRRYQGHRCGTLRPDEVEELGHRRRRCQDERGSAEKGGLHGKSDPRVVHDRQRVQDAGVGPPIQRLGPRA